MINKGCCVGGMVVLRFVGVSAVRVRPRGRRAQPGAGHARGDGGLARCVWRAVEPGRRRRSAGARLAAVAHSEEREAAPWRRAARSVRAAEGLACRPSLGLAIRGCVTRVQRAGLAGVRAGGGRASPASAASSGAALVDAERQVDAGELSMRVNRPAVSRAARGARGAIEALLVGTVDRAETLAALEGDAVEPLAGGPHRDGLGRERHPLTHAQQAAGGARGAVARTCPRGRRGGARTANDAGRRFAGRPPRSLARRSAEHRAAGRGDRSPPRRAEAIRACGPMPCSPYAHAGSSWPLRCGLSRRAWMICWRSGRSRTRSDWRAPSARARVARSWRAPSARARPRSITSTPGSDTARICTSC